MNLVNYGIFNEQVDLRIHVCVLAGKAYTYMPKYGIEAICSGKYATRTAAPAHARYEVTANGYIVPPAQITYCHEYDVGLLIDLEKFNRTDSPTIKGQKALNVVCNMVRLGMICPPSQPEIVTDREMQIAGVDIIIPPCFRAQVKCDYNGGASDKPGVTGNLYLQIAERNPGFI